MRFWDNERVPGKQNIDVRSKKINNTMQNSWKTKLKLDHELVGNITVSDNMPLTN
jgi:hypothetical protein